MMSQHPVAVWLTPNPILNGFHAPLLKNLSQQGNPIAHWEYLQDQDESASLTQALSSLQDYFATLSQPVHLMGHGIGGWLGLLYARQCPEQIKSLTLLSVGTNPALDWQAYYYTLYKHLRCPRNLILEQMVYNLFGEQNSTMTHYLVELLRRDLASSPSPHSLYQQWEDSPGGIDVPLLVCGSEDDLVVPPTAIKDWKRYMNSSQDDIWLTPRGYHFYHYFAPHEVASTIGQFWQKTERQLPIPASATDLKVSDRLSNSFLQS